MTAMGLTPASRSCIVAWAETEQQEAITFRVIYRQPDGSFRDNEGKVVEDAQRDEDGKCIPAIVLRL